MMPEKNAGKTRKFLKEEIPGSHLLLGDRLAVDGGRGTGVISVQVGRADLDRQPLVTRPLAQPFLWWSFFPGQGSLTSYDC